MLFFLLSIIAKIASEAFAEAVTRSFQAIRCGDHLPSMKTLEKSILNGREEEKTFEKTMLDRQIKTETFLISFVLKSELCEIALSRDN